MAGYLLLGHKNPGLSCLNLSLWLFIYFKKLTIDDLTLYFYSLFTGYCINALWLKNLYYNLLH